MMDRWDPASMTNKINTGDNEMKKITLILILVAIALFTLTACGASDSPETVTPEANSVPAAVIAEGQLLPVNWLDQSFSLPGTVESVLVSDGDSVSAGQPLAAYTVSPDAMLTVARAEQELLAAQQALNALKDAADLNNAQAQLKYINAQETLDEAQSNFDADDSAENQVLLDIAAAAFQLAEDELNRIEAGAGVDEHLLKAAEARLNTANASLASAQALVDSHQLKSNLAGTVVDLRIQPGQKITAGIPVMAVADTSSWLVKTDNLSETQVSSIAVGDADTIRLDALPGLDLSGVVTHINARYEEKRGDITYTVTIRVNEVDPAMRWGLTAAVYFQP